MEKQAKWTFAHKTSKRIALILSFASNPKGINPWIKQACSKIENFFSFRKRPIQKNVVPN
jgi:hypothetical protein